MKYENRSTPCYARLSTIWGEQSTLKRKENLTNNQRVRLRDLLLYNLKSVRVYLLREEDFQQFWDYSWPTWAGKFLDEWCNQVIRSQIEPMKKVTTMRRSHRELILNYFRAKNSSPVASSGQSLIQFS